MCKYFYWKIFFAIIYILGGIAEYFTYVAGLTFEEEPDYRHCRNILSAAIKAYGFEDDGVLVYTSGEEKQNSRKVKFVVITNLVVLVNARSMYIQIVSRTY